MAGIKRSRKDESRGRVYSDILAKVIVEMLKSEKNDRVTEIVLALLRENAPSAFVLSSASIANDIAYVAIAAHFNKKERILQNHGRSEAMVFKESVLDSEERSRINEWVEMLFLSLTADASVVFMKKFLEALEKKEEKKLYTESIATLFALFLEGRSVKIDYADAMAYANFILLQLQKRLRFEKMENF